MSRGKFYTCPVCGDNLDWNERGQHRCSKPEPEKKKPREETGADYFDKVSADRARLEVMKALGINA